jgi:hypothetical protein
MSGEVLVDALPYIDSGYDEPGVKQAVFALVEEECKRFKPSKNYLEIFGPVNLHQFEVIFQFYISIILILVKQSFYVLRNSLLKNDLIY